MSDPGMGNAVTVLFMQFDGAERFGKYAKRLVQQLVNNFCGTFDDGNFAV